MSLRDDLLRGYTVKLAELRWERAQLRAREAGVLRHRDLDAIDKLGATTQIQIENLKREIAAYQRLCEELPAHCRAMTAPYSDR
jgi:hypothetical protein